VAKIITLVVLGLLLGYTQGWATSRFYSPNREAGFHVGLLEGALMPAALPVLLMGKDVPIYAPTNVGRLYKVGYILGINICGMVFFGVALWRSRKETS
jgi:cytosine/uracil/thiamine/allantoin permease